MKDPGWIAQPGFYADMVQRQYAGVPSLICGFDPRYSLHRWLHTGRHSGQPYQNLWYGVERPLRDSNSASRGSQPIVTQSAVTGRWFDSILSLFYQAPCGQSYVFVDALD